jgi:hypothetical protein
MRAVCEATDSNLLSHMEEITLHVIKVWANTTMCRRSIWNLIKNDCKLFLSLARSPYAYLFYGKTRGGWWQRSDGGSEEQEANFSNKSIMSIIKKSAVHK